MYRPGHGLYYNMHKNAQKSSLKWQSTRNNPANSIQLSKHEENALQVKGVRDGAERVVRKSSAKFRPLNAELRHKALSTSVEGDNDLHHFNPP